MDESSSERRMYKIGEVCRLADVQPYVLRYWETEFPRLAPNKSGGGQRLYSQEEIDIILRIKALLYTEGFTIAGAKKKLETELTEPVAVAVPSAIVETTSSTSSSSSAGRGELLRHVRSELTEILAVLSREP